jgi:hypothetical protein
MVYAIYILLIFFSIFISITSHKYITNFPLSVLTSSLVFACSVEVLTYFKNGYINPFLPISFAITLLVSAVISYIVGIIKRKS